MKKIRSISLCGLGIALYVTLSMTVKIPLVGHAALDLGYIVLAVYCYHFGPVAGAVVGGVGCMFVSLLTSGWFPRREIRGLVQGEVSDDVLVHRRHTCRICNRIRYCNRTETGPRNVQEGRERLSELQKHGLDF